MKWMLCAALVCLTFAACNNDGTGNDTTDTMTTQPYDNTSVGDTSNRMDTSRPPAIVDSTQRQR